jgi:hypothetical protein
MKSKVIQKVVDRVLAYFEEPFKHCYSKKGPSNAIITIAVELIKTASNFSFDGIETFLSEYGEIQISLYYQEQYLEFIIEDTELINYTYEINEIEKEYKENLSLEEAKQIIKEIGNKLT